MTDKRIISATFSDWRCVKGRKVLQLVFEVPIEQQTEVLTLLGPPGIAEDKWVAIALLSERPKIGGGEPSTSVSGQKGADREAVPIAVPEPKERKAFHTLPLAQQCAMRCEERRFRDFIKEIEPDNFAIANGDVASVVRGYLMIGSRSELGKGNHDADRAWRQLERLYQAYITDQQYAESRRP